MSEEVRGYSGGWKLEDALKEHAFSLELAYWIAATLDLEDAATVHDLGAGAGFYSAFLHQRELHVYASDAIPNNDASLFYINRVDLKKPIDWDVENVVTDATLCLEVGEHIKPEFESIVLDNIANSASKKIIMSWAIPGQGGFGHVNCRPNDYIIEQMVNRGWKHNPEQSEFLRERCSGCSWFENTLMVFDK